MTGSTRYWRPARDLILLGLVGLLTLAALGALTEDARSDRSERIEARDFQTLVRGLGFGTASDLSQGSFAFDPRLSASARQETGALPLGPAYRPERALSIFPYASPGSRTDARVP